MIVSPGNLTIQRLSFFSIVIATLFLGSCNSIKNSLTNVKNPPPVPFVYDYNIELIGKFSTDDRKQLIEQLEQQLHDSIRVRKIQKVIFQTLKNPPVYDSVNADKSVVFMRALLNSVGYLRDTIWYNASFDTVRNQVRTMVHFFVEPRKLFRIDSVSYTLADSLRTNPNRDTLQKLTNNSLADALVTKGSPFSKPLLSSERERLSDIYRDNGFLRFTSDEFLVLWDTVGLALIRPTLDPIEQAQMLERLKARRENPTATVEFLLRENPDTGFLTRYYIGNIRVYPDLNADTSFFYPKFDTVKGYEFVSYQGLFKPRKLVDYIYLRPGEMYRQSNFLQTRNKFNSITAWRLVTINPIPRFGQDTVDFEIKLTPAEKYYFNTNLELSRNEGNFGVEGNLLGLGLNVRFQNRNFLKAANLATTNFRYGIELGTTEDPIQTQQFTFSNTIQFPRKIITRFPVFRDRENVRTIFAFNLGYTNRKNYFDIRSLNTSWGYEKAKNNILFGIRFPNIEFNSLQRGDSLYQMIENNKSYRYIFNDGLILSTIGSFNYTFGKPTVTNQLSASGEVAGLLAGMISGSKFLDSTLYRFIKTDVSFKQTHRIRRTSLAWRIFGGVGFSLPRNHLAEPDSLNFQLPFFRQYYAGGPNSMRAWRIRRLGPGSAIKSFLPTEAPDRFGDIRLELNGEYRFYMFEVKGVFFNGALFTDIGNVWLLRKNEDFDRGHFQLKYLIDDIAIGAGTGLRVDFGFLKIRFDYAYKVKNPSPDITAIEERNKWFYNWSWNSGQLQLGIDYPF